MTVGEALEALIAACDRRALAVGAPAFDAGHHDREVAEARDAFEAALADFVDSRR